MGFPLKSMKSMKAKLLFSAALMGALGFGVIQARTWTSADGEKTFDGEFKSYDADAEMVTVANRGRSLVFELSKLSEADQAFVKEQKTDGGASDDAAIEEFAETKMGKALREMKILEDSKFTEHQFAKPPEYFILYYSASW